MIKCLWTDSQINHSTLLENSLDYPNRSLMGVVDGGFPFSLFVCLFSVRFSPQTYVVTFIGSHFGEFVECFFSVYLWHGISGQLAGGISKQKRHIVHKYPDLSLVWWRNFENYL